MINISGCNLADPHLPYGGFGLREFANVESIQVTES